MKYYIIINILIIILTKIFYKNTKKINYNKLLNKGYYISKLGNCISCHTNKGAPFYTGGLPIKTNFGKIYTPNITIINKMKFKEFKNILKLGINKNFNFLYPVFPYINYSKIKKIDLKSLYFYLKKNKYIKTTNKINNLNFPYKYKKILLIWRFLFFKKNKYKKNYIYNNRKRSNYIIKTLGHCNMCHTKINKLGFNINFLNYLGDYKNIINATSFLKLKKENINNLINILKKGASKKKIILNKMIKIINNSLKYVNKIDIKNISIFIKKFSKKNFFKNIKLKKINNYNYLKGKILYKENCLSCHGITKLGKIFIPNLIKNLKNKNSYNVTKFIKKPLIFNNNYYLNSNIMPKLKLEDKNIKEIIQYIFVITNLS